MRRELGFDDDDLVVGMVSRLDHWKGVEVFLRAAALDPNARFVVARGPVDGRQEFAAGLHALVRELGVDVQFTEWRYGPDRIAGLHAALDVLVLPSVWPQPFGLVLIEAMASGKPVIASRHGGPLEIVEEGESGLLVAPGDVERWLGRCGHCSQTGRGGSGWVARHTSARNSRSTPSVTLQPCSAYTTRCSRDDRLPRPCVRREPAHHTFCAVSGPFSPGACANVAFIR